MKQPPEGQPLNPFSDSARATPVDPNEGQPSSPGFESDGGRRENPFPVVEYADALDAPTLDLGEQPIIGRYQMSPTEEIDREDSARIPDDRPATPRRAIISPEDMPPEGPEPERRKLSGAAIGLIIAGGLLFVGMVVVVAMAAIRLYGVAETASELSPGKCVVVSGPNGNTKHQVHDCEVSEEHAWVVASNPKNKQCGKDYFYYSKREKLLGIQLGEVRSCLAPLLHEGKCYLEDSEGVVPSDCATGAIEATKVAKTGDAAVCSEGTGVLNYPEIPVTYCLRRVQ